MQSAPWVSHALFFVRTVYARQGATCAARFSNNDVCSCAASSNNHGGRGLDWMRRSAAVNQAFADRDAMHDVS